MAEKRITYKIQELGGIGEVNILRNDLGDFTGSGMECSGGNHRGIGCEIAVRTVRRGFDGKGRQFGLREQSL